MQVYFHQHLDAETIELSEEESAHLRVLRTSVGEMLWLTDGNGILAEAEIVAVGKKTFSVSVKNRQKMPKFSFSTPPDCSLLRIAMEPWHTSVAVLAQAYTMC